MIERPILLAIAGPTCSGKTTLEQGLVSELCEQADVLPFDDMAMSVGDLTPDNQDCERPEMYRFSDYRRHLSELQAGKTTLVNPVGWETRCRGLTSRLVMPRKFIISAGFLALHDMEARQYFDLKIYLDLPEADIIARREAREWQLGLQFDPMPYILKHILPANRRFVEPQRQFADLVLDARKPAAALVEKTMAALDEIT